MQNQHKYKVKESKPKGYRPTDLWLASVHTLHFSVSGEDFTQVEKILDKWSGGLSGI